ncbi:16135_t:CDS:2, partial [Acaulospora colombiana]
IDSKKKNKGNANPKVAQKNVEKLDVNANIDTPKKIPQLSRMTSVSENVKGLDVSINVGTSESTEKISSKSHSESSHNVSQNVSPLSTGGATRRCEDERRTIIGKDDQRSSVNIAFVANIVDSLNLVEARLPKNKYLLSKNRDFWETNHIMYLNEQSTKHVRRILWS